MLPWISFALPAFVAPSPGVLPALAARASVMPALAVRAGVPTLSDSEATRDAESNVYVGVAAALAEAQAATLARVVADLNLHPRDSFEVSFEVGAGAGSAAVSSFTNQPKLERAESLEAARAIANAGGNAMAGTKFPVAWLSSLGVPGDTDCLYTLTAWNLPAVSTPRLCTRCRR